MKQSGKRILSACLLLSIALAASVGVIRALTVGASSAPSAGGNETFLWARLGLNVDASVDEIRIYGHDGKPVQILQPKNGAAVSGLLTPGTYFAATALGCTEFTLHKNASVSVSSGCGWSDGEQLYLTDAQVGAVTVERLASAHDVTEDGGWIDFTLVSGETRLREVVRCSAAQEVLTCTFEGVPYGEYVLAENGVAQCRVTVDESTPEVAVSLP